MTAIVSPHVYCNDGIITDLSGYGCIPGNLGLPELLNNKFDKTGDAYIDEPEIPTVPNMAIVRSPDGQSWLHTPDYRGSVAYDKETKQQAEITELGKLPDNLTLDAPKTPFDKWNGKKWVTDKTEQRVHEVAVAESQKQSLLAEAEQEIAMLERKIRLNMATESDRTN